jgi:hypothetical protein
VALTAETVAAADCVVIVTGHADVDALVWFDFVHTDEPWAQVPAVAPERLLPSRCGLFSEFPSRVQPALN